MKKRTLSFQVTFTMVCILAGTVLVCWLLNTFFLENYYITYKERSIESAFSVVAEASADGALMTDEFDVVFESICSKDNVDIMIVRSDGVVVKSSANNNQELREQFLNAVFLQGAGDVDVVLQTDDYAMMRQEDTRLESDYLSLWGTLPDGNFILIRSALESIRDATSISTRFLLITGCIVIVAAVFIVYFLTKKLTAPIRGLTEISRRMSKLDFEAHYEGRSSKEVDELGEHMNELSGALETTIRDLKTANNELVQDIKRKTEIDEMRKEFLSNVSHELKTPLALISGYAEGLKEGVTEDPESADYYLEVIMDEAGRMNRMVNELLTLNNIEFGKEGAEMARFDLTAVIRGVLERLGLQIEKEGIRVSFDEKGEGFVWADEFLVEEVLTNYLTNAIHHSAGTKEIRVILQRAGNLVYTFVQNTGAPIPEEDLSKVWVKFYKVDKARTREYGGSGIGLSIVKAIQDSMNQQYGVRNTPDGVEFWFTLEGA
jgi:signal transduction histidine kinase